VRSYAIPEPKAARRPVDLGWRPGDSRSSLIDTRLVRVELARLRAPRPLAAVVVTRSSDSISRGGA